MDLFTVINPNILHTYSNIDFSTIIIADGALHTMGKFDFDKLNMFVDIFDNVNKYENSGITGHHYTLADNIILMMYHKTFNCELTNKQKMKILFKLFSRGFVKSMFDLDYKKVLLYSYVTHDSSYNDHKKYFDKYYNTITNLFRLTNSTNIDMCNLDDTIIDAIRVLLLITKTRVIPQEVALKSLPKYIILHKILLFYLTKIET